VRARAGHVQAVGDSGQAGKALDCVFVVEDLADPALRDSGRGAYPYLAQPGPFLEEPEQFAHVAAR
jgi:hypothetical protein